jgi:hypothetical protein
MAKKCGDAHKRRVSEHCAAAIGGDVQVKIVSAVPCETFERIKFCNGSPVNPTPKPACPANALYNNIEGLLRTRFELRLRTRSEGLLSTQSVDTSLRAALLISRKGWSQCGFLSSPLRHVFRLGIIF